MLNGKRIYLDNNASTKIDPEVLEAMRPYFNEYYGNASSIHVWGQEAKNALDKARQQVAKLIGAEVEEIVFTSGGTESDNWAIRGVLNSSSQKTKHVITTKIEHHAVLNTCQELQRQGIKISYVPVDSYGIVDPTDIEKLITPDTVLISIMHSNNETGTLQPLQAISQIARSKNVLLHTDAIQSVGKIDLDIKELGVDLLSLSGHKFHAPKGIGTLYIRKGTKIKPLIYGGAQEKSRRAGTENIPSIVALGKAAEIAVRDKKIVSEKVRQLRDYFEKEILAQIPMAYLNGDPSKRLPNTSNIRFDKVEAEGVVINLDLLGVACSTGSACTSGSIEPSHVLSAMGLSPQQAAGSMRFSLSKFTTKEEIDYVISILPNSIEQMRKLAAK